MPSPILHRALAPLCRGRGAALFAIVLAALPLLAACARPAPLDQPMALSVLPAPGELLSDAGDPLPPEAFVRQAAGAAYVLIGEGHANPCDHEAERRILTLLAHGGQGFDRGFGQELAVGLEMVPATYTGALRDFVAGKTAPEDLPGKLDWARTWGHPFAGYLPVFTALREWKLPAAGLNVPPDVIRRLSAAAMHVDNATASGPAEAFAAAAVNALSPEDRALLPARIIGPAPEQLAMLREVMAGHPGGRDPGNPRQMARFELIQSVWDSAMAEQAVRLRRETGRQVAVLAGAGHVDGGLGIARRLRVLDPGAVILLVSPWRGDEFAQEYASANGQVRVYCPVTFESRMGMVLENSPQTLGGDDDEWRVVVRRVVRGSRAEAAGLRPGDVVERAGGHRMRSLATLHLAGSDAYRQKKNLVFVVRRGAERYTVDFGPLGAASPAASPATTPAVSPAASPAASPAGSPAASQAGKPAANPMEAR